MTEPVARLDLEKLEELLYREGITPHAADRLIATLPWFIGKPFMDGDGYWQDEFPATGIEGRDDQTFDVFDGWEGAVELAVAAVNALPDLIARLRLLEAQVEKAEGERNVAQAIFGAMKQYRTQEQKMAQMPDEANEELYLLWNLRDELDALLAKCVPAAELLGAAREDA